MGTATRCALVRKVFGALIVIGLTIAWSGCGTGRSGDQQVVARVGSAVLRLADIKAAFPENPSLSVSEAQVRSYVQRWINMELLAQEAKRRGLHRDKKVRHQLESLRREALATAMEDQLAGDTVTVSSEELRAHYERNQEAFRRTEDEYLLQEILVSSWQEANQLRTRILNGESFARLAAQCSQASSARDSGTTGYLRRAQMLPELAQQVPRAPVGKVLSPIKTEAGYYLVKVVEVKPAGSIRELAEVEALLHERVLLEKLRERRRQLLDRVRGRQTVYVDYGALRQALPDSTTAAP
ncbi:MAG: foldase protein PrsA [Candidatus Oleimicrobiaceae bacterium]